MAVIKVLVDDAWTADDGYVYGILEDGKPLNHVIEAMNGKLRADGYAGRITLPGQLKEVWVRPQALLEDGGWGSYLVSEKYQEHWAHLLCASTEEL